MSAIYQAIAGAAPHAHQGKVKTPMASALRDANVATEESVASRQTPAGWYPDTGDSGKMRYWDGTGWTDHFKDGAATPDVGPTPRSAPQRQEARPYGQPVPPWSEQLSSQSIVGESFHEADFKRLAAEHGHKAIPDYGIELTETRAALVPEPDNRYDPNAVAVWIDDRYPVGHLPRHLAAEFSSRLERLDRGTYLQVPARVWVGPRTDWDERTGAEVRRVVGSVTVRLPDPDGIVPYNDLPEEPHTVLPWGRAVQLTGEELHMDALRTFALGSAPRHVAATLHVIEEPRRTGDPARVIEVRLDGQRVGVMSKAISEQIHDLVTYVAGNGKTPVARAVIKGSDLRADVAVNVARTSDVPQKWLDSVTV
jgi:hypothetical protein